MSAFYTYLWLRKDGTPYYVGKGSGNRAFKLDNHQVRPPKEQSRVLIVPCPSEEIALEEEKLLISCYGRKDDGTGILRNKTNGGDGQSKGWIPSAEWRRKQSEAKKQSGQRPPKMFGNKFNLGRKQSETWRQTIHAINTGNRYALGRIQTAEERQKRSKSMMGNTNAKKKEAA